MKAKILTALSLLLFAIAACRPNPLGLLETPTSTPQPVIPVEQLQFKDAPTGERFRALDGCIRDMMDSSWKTTGYEMRGNFYTAAWCSGAGTRDDCGVSYGTQHNRDQQVIELYTLFYSQDFPEVFGIGFQSTWVPDPTGWGAHFYFAEKGETVVGEGWGVTFKQYVDSSGPPASALTLGWDPQYDFSEPTQGTIESSSELGVRDDLALYLRSPEAMRDRGLEELRALAGKVQAAIEGGQVETCDYGPYLGKGLPPACTLRPLTAEEQDAELARAEDYFAEQEQLLREHYQEMYAAWLRAFPFEECWGG